MSIKNKITSLPREALKSLFNQTGLRFTHQREAVWRLFEEHPRGFTIAEAAAILAADKISQTTVYRTVSALQEMGYIKWVHNQTGEHRYVASHPGHSHLLVCRSCAKTVECTDCDMSVLEKLITQKTGFAIEGHHLEFFGLCPDCI